MKDWKRLPLVSASLVLVNVIVFIICKFTGEWLYDLGGLELWKVAIEHEYGRVVWAFFLHADEGHIFNNMIILFFLGAMLEEDLGHFRYALLYFVSGIAGNLLSLFGKYRTGDLSVTIGASGAIFGLDGALLALVLFSERRMGNVTPVRVVLMIALSLYSGFTGPNIDNAAHVGGLAAGFICGIVYCLMDRIQAKGGEGNLEY